MKLLEFKSGRLTFVSCEKVDKRKIYTVKCECGNVKTMRDYEFRKQIVKSCGCLLKEKAKIQCSINSKKHNLTETHIHKVWSNAKDRCYRKKNNRYDHYGAKGIKMCDEWKEDFQKFYQWAINNGYVVGLSLERKDLNGDYEPNNCIWISKFFQARNKSNTYRVITKDGEKTLREFSSYAGISESGVRHFCERNKIPKLIDGELLLSQYRAKTRPKG